MPAGLPIELRQRVVEAVEQQELTWKQIATVFNVSEPTIHRLMLKHRAGESLEPKTSPGAVAKLGDAERSWIRSAIESDPYVTSYELTARYNRHFRHNRVHRSTILRAMHALGFSHKKNTNRTAAGAR